MAEGAGGSFDQTPEQPRRWRHEHLQYEDGHIALRVNGERGTQFRFGETKFKYDPGDHHSQKAIVRTKFGNEYFIAPDEIGTGNGKFIINVRETQEQHRLVAAYATDFAHQVPPLEFQRPWNIPGFQSTSDVVDMLLQYKVGEPGKHGAQQKGTNPFYEYSTLINQYDDQAERLSERAMSGLPSTENYKSGSHTPDPKPWWRRLIKR